MIKKPVKFFNQTIAKESQEKIDKIIELKREGKIKVYSFEEFIKKFPNVLPNPKINNG
jgi:hypothetical protein